MCFDALIGVLGSPHLLKNSRWGFIVFWSTSTSRGEM